MKARKSASLIEDKKKLAIDLILLKDKQVKNLDFNLTNLKLLRNELVDLEINSKNTVLSQIALRFKISKIISKLEKNGLDKEKLEYFSEDSMKKYEEFKKDSGAIRALKSNEKLIKNLVLEIDAMIIKLNDKIKSWRSDRKKYLSKYKLSNL